MHARKRFALGLLSSLLLTSPCWSQTYAGPAIQSTPPSLWNLMCPSVAQSEAFNRYLVRPPAWKARYATIGQAILFSPHHISERQPANDREDSGIVGVAYMEDAAPIKQEDANLKERREAVRYLGTVDCKRWPEASDRLVEALLKDTSDDIRLEAALALSKGNCCTPSTLNALQRSATAKNPDGSSVEKSERVRKAAAEALARCETGQKELPKVQDNNNNGEPRKPAEPSLEELRARAAAVQLTYTPRADSVSALVSQAMGGRTGFMQDVRRQLTGRQETAPPPAIR